MGEVDLQVLQYLLNKHGKPGRTNIEKKTRKEMFKETGMCVVCGTDERLDVHHIVPNSKNTEDFAVLCSNCHQALHYLLGSIGKESRIQTSRQKVKKRMGRGLPVGKPPYGLRYNKDKTVFIPNEDFDKVKKVLELKDRNGSMSYTQLVNETGVPRTTVFKIIKKEEMYRTVIEHGYLSEEVRKAFKHMYGRNEEESYG